LVDFKFIHSAPSDDIGIYKSRIAAEKPDLGFHMLVGNNEVSRDVLFGLKADPGEVHGIAFEDLDHDGVKDTNEQGLADWTIYIDRDSNGALDAGEPSTTTDAAGSYAFFGLEPFQTYVIAQQPKSSWVQTLPKENGGKWIVTLGAKDIETGVNFGNVQVPGGGAGSNGAFRGQVYLDNDGNGSAGPGESGRGGIVVYLDQPNTGTRGQRDPLERFTTTDINGQYEFNKLAGGTYYPRIEIPSGTRQTTPLGNVFQGAPTEVGEGPKGSAAGDFDKDGDQDLAVTIAANNRVWVLFNNGSGSFTRVLSLAAGTDPRSISAVDVTGDDWLDLIVSNNLSNNVSIFVNKATPGEKDPFRITPTRNRNTQNKVNAVGGPAGIATGKFDTDVHTDLAVVNFNTNEVAILKGLGSGDFSIGPIYDLGPDNGLFSIVAGKFNPGDALDLAVANQYSHAVTILSGNGSGGFTVASPIATGPGPYAIAAAHLDNDEYTDLVTANSQGSSLTVHWGSASGAFTRQDVSAGQGPSSVVTIDIDKDGDLDLAVSNATDVNVAVLRNRGGRAFDAPETAGVTPFSAGAAFSIAAADFDGDPAKTEDLAVVVPNRRANVGNENGRVTLLRNTIVQGNSHVVALTGNETAAVTGLDFGLLSDRPPVISPGQVFPIIEDAPGGFVLGKIEATDPDPNDTITFTMNDDCNQFALSLDGTLSLRVGASLDHETRASCTLPIHAQDTTNLTDDEPVTINITNANEAPTEIRLSNSTVRENEPAAVIGDVTVVDPDVVNVHELTVTDGRFEIKNGSLRLKDGQSLNSEASRTIDLGMNARDGAFDLARDFTITVVDVCEPPVAITLSNHIIAENVAGAMIGDIRVVDPDAGEPHILEVDHPSFEIKDGKLWLKEGQSLDYEATPNGNVVLNITATDSCSQKTVQFLIVVTNVNEAPTGITLSSNVVAENALGAVIGDVSVIDPDSADTHTLMVSDSRFDIQDGKLRLKEGQALDFEASATIGFQITATDANRLEKTVSFQLNVTNVNERPTAITLSNTIVAENARGAVIGDVKVVDPDANDAHDYDVFDPQFEIVSGKLKLKEGQSLDFENKPTRIVTIEAKDKGTLVKSEDFSIVVLDVNEQVTLDPILSPSAIAEDADSQTIQLTGISAGPKEIQHLTVTAVSSNRELVPDPMVNYESPAPTGSLSYKPIANQAGIAVITVTVVDVDQGGAIGGPNTITRSFAVVVVQANDPPTGADDTRPIIPEDIQQRIPIATLVANDSNGVGNEDDQTLTIIAVSDPQGGTAAVNGTEIVFTPSADYSGPAAFRYVLQDNGTTSGLPDFKTSTATVRFDVIAINDAPSFSTGQVATGRDFEELVSLPGWAQNRMTGPANEANQSLVRFEVEVVGDTNPSLFEDGGAPAIDLATGNLTFNPRANAHGTVQVNVRLKDDGGTANGGVDTSATQTFHIVIDKPLRWHNTERQLDVTGAGGIPDGQVVPGDALAIINFINSFGSGPVPDGVNRPIPPGFELYGPDWLDTAGGPGTQGDNQIVPNDALAVINFINAFGSGKPGPAGEGQGEGEGAVALEGTYSHLQKTGGQIVMNDTPALPHLSVQPGDIMTLLAIDVASEQWKRRRRAD
jgi:hypothetical protein